MRALLLVLPDEALPMLIVAAGLAFIVGARQFGRGMLVAAAALVFLPLLLAPVFDALPGWLFFLVLAAMAIAVLFALLRGMSSMLIGSRATDHMVGALAADVVKATALGTLRAGAVVLGLTWRAASALLRRAFRR